MTVVSTTSPEAIARAIQRNWTDPPPGSSSSRESSYRSPQGREFEIREVPAGLFVSELRPNGKLCTFDSTGELVGIHDEPALKRIADQSPNRFREAAREAGYDPDTCVRLGDGFSVGSIYYASVHEVAEAISDALAADRWYDSVDRAYLADPARQAEARARVEADRTAYETWKAEQRERAQQLPDLFKGLYNLHGPLGTDVQRRLLAYLNDPTEDGWDDIRGIMLSASTTVWQAWAAVDPQAPVSKPADAGWPRIPDASTLRRALRWAAGENDTD
jgi:hypothetical protein